MDSSGEWNDTGSSFYSGRAQEGGVLFSASTSSILLDGTTMVSNSAEQGGGCLFLASMLSFTMRAVTLQECSTSAGGGGAIHALRAPGLTIKGRPNFRAVDSRVIDCRAGGSGGGFLLPMFITVELVSVRVQGCSSSLQGGAMAILEGDTCGGLPAFPASAPLNITMENCTLEGNRAVQGGGIFSDVGPLSNEALPVHLKGTLRLVNNTAFTPSAAGRGGELAIAPGVGGGLYLRARLEDLRGLDVAVATALDYIHDGVLQLDQNHGLCGTSQVGTSFRYLEVTPPEDAEPGTASRLRVDLWDALNHSLCTSDFFVARMDCDLCTPHEQSLHSNNGSLDFHFRVTSSVVAHGETSVAITISFDELLVNRNVTANVTRCSEGKGFDKGFCASSTWFADLSDHAPCLSLV